METTAATIESVNSLPGDVLEVFSRFFTAELTTIGRSGIPITWPIMPIYWQRKGLFVTLTSIGLPQKAINIRRNPHVSLLFSDPTGSELLNPPAVLVQGTAEAPNRVLVSRQDADPELWQIMTHQALEMLKRQPAMKIYLNNPVSRYLMDWYFMRLLITIRPERVVWWPDADFSGLPRSLEVAHVV